MEIKIIFEDNHLLVVEKPANMPTQSDSSGDLDLLSYLKNDLKNRYQKPGNVYLGLIHRLDRPVGGVMVFAKTSKAASRLSAQIREGGFGKHYFAVVRGYLATDQGRLTNYLVKDFGRNVVSVVAKPIPGAKEAILDYGVVGKREQLSLLKIVLGTGRSHQIRVQLAAIGHPLYGDQKYGSRLNHPGEQLALFSFELQFQHPTTKEYLEFKASPSLVYPWIIFKDLLKVTRNDQEGFS
ncbi:MAG: RluA family pseudouridine synthase [Firmicutes bacterium]|nr:RluA family pseudouridine synthase [Bacillota bacterium]